MIRLIAAAASLVALLTASTALAGNVAKCEVVALLTVTDESGGSASYRYYFPASDFLSSVYDPEIEITREQDGHPIEGITCERRDLMPDEEDYAILATGIPMVLSQDFDRPDTDVLTLFFAGDSFQHRYLSETEIDSDFEDKLNTLLADFSERDHGLGEKSETSDTDESEALDDADTEIDEINEQIATDPEPLESLEKEAAELIDADVVIDDVSDSADDLPIENIIVAETEIEAEIAASASDIEGTDTVSDVTDLVFDPETGQLVQMGSEDE